MRCENNTRGGESRITRFTPDCGQRFKLFRCWRFKLLRDLELDAGYRVVRCAQDGGIRPVEEYFGDCWDGGDLVVIEVMLVVKM